MKNRELQSILTQFSGDLDVMMNIHILTEYLPKFDDPPFAGAEAHSHITKVKAEIPLGGGHFTVIQLQGTILPA